MWVSLFIPAFLLGAVSSLHCLGMCGPIALSLPLQGRKPGRRLAGMLLYNLGRVLAYAVIGLLFGFLGRQVYLAGWQQVFSVGAGVLMLGVVLAGLFNRSVLHLRLLFIHTGVQKWIARFMGRPQWHALFLVGVGNGFLPCGMVYLALTGAMATGTVESGVAFMVCFGLGTVPAMLLLGLVGALTGGRTRAYMRQAAPFVMTLVAFLLILRGLNLGIPYLSPHFDNSVTNAAYCH